jgi:hypothetical protein
MPARRCVIVSVVVIMLVVIMAKKKAIGPAVAVTVSAAWIGLSYVGGVSTWCLEIWADPPPKPD